MAIEEKDINIYLAVSVQTVIDLFFEERKERKTSIGCFSYVPQRDLTHKLGMYPDLGMYRDL